MPNSALQARSAAADKGRLPAPDEPGDANRVQTLLEGSVENLLASWHPGLGRFPFSSRRVGTTLSHDYMHPASVRYTVNSLLGLAAAARNPTLGVTDGRVGVMLARFLACTSDRLLMPSDHGLLAILDRELSSEQALLSSRMRSIGALLRDPARLNMQDLAWLLWGAVAAYQAGVGAGADRAREALELILTARVDPGTGLPRHAGSRYRRNVVSFGSLVYFLRAMHEASVALGDARAQRLFEQGVARTISFQGPQGEWPWMIDCRQGRPFDRYPVFAVHQDSMAMLFLHPALDQGLAGVAPAVSRSLAWDFGANELGVTMFTERPFFAFRSIERTERLPRARRYLRSVPGSLGRVSEPQAAASIRVNDECRSYHLGWILFAWSSRPSRDTESTPPDPVRLIA